MNIIKELNREKEFNEKPQDYVYARYKEYIKTGKYPYLRDVVDYIINKLKEINYLEENILKQLHNLTEIQTKNLHREVFLCSELYQKEEEGKHTQEMLNKGWKILTIEDVKEAFENKRKLRVISTNSTIMGDCEINKIYKPFIDNEGNIYLMKPRATRKGYHIGNFIYHDRISFFKYL